MSHPNAPVPPVDPFAEPAGSYPGTGSSRKQVEGWIDTLYRRRWIIVASLLVAALVAGYSAFMQTPVYEATAVVLVDLNRMPGGNQAELVGTTPFVRSDRTVNAELFVIRNSGAIHRRVDERLRQMAAEGDDVTYPARGSVSFAAADRSVGSAINIRATSPDPREAAVLANLFAEEYVRQTADASRSYLVAMRTFLEEQEQVRRQELREAEEAYEAYLRRTGAGRLTQEMGALINRLAMVDAQLDDAMIELRAQEAALAQTNRQIEEISPRLGELVAAALPQRMSVLGEELVRLRQNREARVMALVERGRQQEVATDPEVREWDRRIAEAEAEYRRLANQFAQETMAVGGINPGDGAAAAAAGLVQQSFQGQIQVESLRSRIDQIERQRRQIEGNLGVVPELTTEVARLERQRAYAEQMYRAVVTRLQEVRMQEAAEPGYARILRQAGVPSVPAGDGPWKGLGIGLLLGLIVGVVLAVVRDRLDTRIYKPEQVRALGVPVTGVIPNLAPQIAQTHGGAAHAEREGERIATSLVTLLDPLSAPSEAYRHLRTAVQFSRMDQVVGVVLVTSAAAGEGKSTSAANLAVTMAQARRRTLLVDADLRRPNQHQLFGLSDERGLAQLLHADEADLPATPEALAAWMETFRSRQHPDLYVLPAGMAGLVPSERSGDPVNPAELFGTRRVRDLLARLREGFDVIVLDTPPVLAATDAVLLATQADVTLMVVRAGKTKEGDLEHGLEMLQDVGAHLGGVLLNGFDLSMAYGYRYSYGHYTKYGPYSRYGYAQGSARHKGRAAKKKTS